MEMKDKVDLKKKIRISIIVLGILLIIGGVIYYLFENKLFSSKEEIIENNNNGQENIPVAEAFEGIFIASNDKMYIHKIDDNRFNFVIANTFEGTAKIVNQNTAREDSNVDKNKYFDFKLVDDGIEVIYNTNKNDSPNVEIGLYKKVLDYSRENVYREEVGDILSINSVCSGLYSSNNGIELYVIPISENKIRVKKKLDDKSQKITFSDEEFVITSDKKIKSYSSESKDKVDYELDFVIKSIDDKDLKVIVHDDVPNFNENNKKIESNYKFVRNITIDEILDEFYSNY